MIETILAHGTGDAFDLLLFLVVAVLVGGSWMTVRRMRELEQREGGPGATTATPPASAPPPSDNTGG